MSEIIYVKGDATNPLAKGNKIIAHICNDIGGWVKALFWQFLRNGSSQK